MSWKGRALLGAAPMIDLLIAPAVWAAAQTLMLVRRITPPRAPRSMRVLDGIGLYPLIDHYYEPLINHDHLRVPLDRVREIPGLATDAAAGLQLLEDLAPFGEMRDIPMAAPTGPRRYHFANGFFGPLDAAALHGLIRRHRPRRILEVGCGLSTLVALRAAAMNAADDPAGEPCEHVCIEPYEHPWLAELPVRLVRGTAETADPALVEALGPGDILFIDSSHMIRPQGDVLTEVLDWLGRLRPGVLVHIHDVFTPRDYPDSLIRTHRFFWNEQYLVEAFLAFNPHFEVLLPMYHMHLTYPDRLRAMCPAQDADGTVPPSSFWLRRRD